MEVGRAAKENCVCFFYMFLFSITVSLEVRDSTIFSKSKNNSVDPPST